MLLLEKFRELLFDWRSAGSVVFGTRAGLGEALRACRGDSVFALSKGLFMASTAAASCGVGFLGAACCCSNFSGATPKSWAMLARLDSGPAHFSDVRGAVTTRRCTGPSGGLRGFIGDCWAAGG